MPGATPKGYPYAQPADPLVQWPATSQALAEKIEAESANVPILTVAGVKIAYGQTATNNNGLVTFPTGLFTAPPTVIVAPSTGANPSGGDLTATVGNITKDRCEVNARIAFGANAGTPFGIVTWIAIGV